MGAVLGFGVGREDPEFAAIERHLVLGAPVDDLAEACGDAFLVPLFPTVLLDHGLRVRMGLEPGQEGGHGVRARRIGHAAQGFHGLAGPGGALVGEREGVVAMERVDDIAVGQELELPKAVDAAPVGAGGDEGVPGRVLPNDAGEARVEDVPFLLAPVEHGFVDDLQQGELGIEPGQPGGEGGPEPREGILPRRVEFRGAILVVQVDDHQQPGLVKPAQSRLDVSGTILAHRAGGGVHDDLRGDAQPDVPQPDARHEPGLGLRDVPAEVPIVLRARKPEPAADVGAGAEAVQASGRYGEVRFGRPKKRPGTGRDGQRGKRGAGPEETTSGGGRGRIHGWEMTMMMTIWAGDEGVRMGEGLEEDVEPVEVIAAGRSSLTLTGPGRGTGTRR